MAREQTHSQPNASHLAIMAGLAGTIDWISEKQGRLSSLLILLAVFQVCFELVMRYFFNAPTEWGLEMTVYLCGTTYVMSGAYAERYGAHIRVDVFYSRWRSRTRAWFDLLVADLFLFAFSGILFWQSAAWFQEAVTQGLTSGTLWDPPVWPMRLVIVLGSLMLFISGIPKFLRHLAHAVWNARI